MNKINYVLLVFLVLSGLVHPVFGNPLEITPVLSFNQTYNDNIFFSKNNKDHDFITTASGRLFVKKKTHRLDARLGVEFDRIIYHELSEYDSWDKLLSGQADYRVSERMGLGVSAQYVKDSQRDSKIDTSGLVVMGDRNAKDFSLSGSYMFAEMTKGEIDIGFEQENIEQCLDREDNENFSVNMMFSKDISQTFKGTTGLFSINYSNYTSGIEEYISDDISTTGSFKDYKSDVWQMYTGFSRDITKLYTVYFQVGASFSKTHEEKRTRMSLNGINAVISSHVILEDDAFGAVLFTGLNYSGEKSDAKIAVSHDVKQGSGTNGAVERSSVSADFTRKVTDSFQTTFKTSWYLNKNERETSKDIDEQTFNIQPGFRYKIADDLVLFGIYRATLIKDRQDSTSSNRNLVYIEITKNFNSLSY